MSNRRYEKCSMAMANSLDLKPRLSWDSEVRTGTRLLNIAGIAFSLVFLCGFGVWAGVAPISSAAILHGVVAALGQNQRVQHLEGGIVSRILVKEGDRISRGEPLLELDETAAQAQRNRLVQQEIGLYARAVRLGAERDGRADMRVSDDLRTRAATEKADHLLSEQRAEFNIRLARHRQERIILRQRVNMLDSQIRGLESQRSAIEQQLNVVREETARKLALLEQGLTNRSEYTLLLRSEAELVGQLGQIVSSVLSTRTQILEAEEQYARLDTQRVETAVTQLNDIRAQQGDVAEQLRQATDVLSRTIMRSPSDGVVVKLNVNSRGSVVRPGDSVLELLPTSDDLTVEARVLPSDIDVVSIGQEARLHFTALNVRTTSTVKGVITYVSADRLFDTVNGQPYYSARLRINEDISKLSIDANRIYPGMPVEVFVSTGERTFVEYLTQPIRDSIDRAFREQ